VAGNAVTVLAEVAERPEEIDKQLPGFDRRVGLTVAFIN